MGRGRVQRYVHIRNDLARKISEGVWRQGDAIPAEAELARIYEVAIGTIRQAVEVLASEGLVERLHGKGTFVKRPDFATSLFRFFRHVSGDGTFVLPTGQIRDRVEAVPPEEVRNALNLPTSARAIRTTRLRSIAGKKVLIEEIWLPAARVPNLLNIDPARFEPLLYPAYEEIYGIIITRAEETLRISSEPEALAGLIDAVDGDPLVIIERLAFDQDGMEVEWRRSIAKAIGFTYKIDVR